MGESERPFRSLRTGDDYSHLLGLLDDGEKLIDVDLADRRQELKAKTASDHRGCRQYLFSMLVEPLEAAPDDESHIFRNVALVDLDVGAELTGRIEDFSLFDQMSAPLLVEERSCSSE